MAEARVSVLFTGNSVGAVRASEKTADSIKRIGVAGREAAHGVDEIRERAEAGTRAINEERRALDRLKVASLLGGAAGAAKWGLLAGGIASLGAVSIGALAALGPLAGGIAALPGLLTAAALAMGTVKLATSGVSEALKGNKKALAELTPAGRQFVATLQSFEPLLEKIRTTAQKGLFPGLLDALNSLKTPAVFAVLNKAVAEMSKSLGSVASQFGRVVGSQKFLQTFSIVAQAAAHWMQQFGTFAVKGFDAMLSLTRAAIPLTNWMGDLSVRFATYIDNAIKAASASGRLQEFFQGVREEVTLIGTSLGSLGSALISVFRVALPFGNALFQQLGRGADAVKRFADSAQGHASIAAFFKSVSNALSGVGPIIGALLAGIGKVAPAMLNATGNIARALGPALVPAIGLAARALVAYLNAVSRVSQALGPVILRGVNAVRSHLPGITQAAQRVVGYFRSNFLPPLTSVMRSVGAAAAAMAGVIRRNWPQISSIARSIGSIVSSSMRVVAAAVKAVAPVVRALGPVFRVAFIAASAAVRVQAAVIRATLAGVIGTINAVKGAIGGLIGAWNALRSAASHVVNFIVRQSGQVQTGQAGRFTPRAGRARGGFIPGPPGAAVPILAHAGEVVLNQAQQQSLGGAHEIARMFGFTGEEGPSLATGGFVRPRRRSGGWKPVTKKAPHRPLRARARAASKAGKAAVRAADAVHQSELDLETAYGQLTRQYNISPDAYGNSLDVGEIDSLIAERGKKLALLDVEKQKLEDALAALDRAIAALVKEIQSEQAAIKDDLQRLAAERGKKRPNRKLIASLQKDVSTRRSVIGTMQGELGTMRKDVTTEKRNIIEVGFDHRDGELDILELQQTRRDVLAAIADAQASGDSGGFGGGPDDLRDASPGGGGGSSEHLLAIIGQLRQALGIEHVQIPILGQFQKGTLHVPETGLYQLHAGESVTPSGRARGGDGVSIGDMPVTLRIDGDSANAQALRAMMKDVSISAWPEISRKTGRRADELRRGGRI